MSLQKYSKTAPLLKITLKPSFLFIVAFILSFDSENLSFFSLLASLLHEASHVAVLLILRIPSRLTFKLGGMSLKVNSALQKREWLYLIAGPFSNLLVFFLFPKTLFGAVNLLVGAVNLLPIYFTDGGRLLSLFLSRFLSATALHVTETVVSTIFLVPLFTVGLFVLFKSPYNFTLLIAAVYLITALISGKALD